MKKHMTGLLTVLAAATVLQLTGCGNAIPEMTEREQRMVTEYAAQLLLKYDANYQNTILTEEEILAAEEEMIRDAELAAQVQEEQRWREEQRAQQAAQSQASGNGNETSESTAPVYTDIDSFLNLSEIEIEYAGYLICDSYPQSADVNDWQGVARASSVNTTLVVFTFTLTNVSGSDYLLDMASTDTKFTFRINNDIVKSSLTTLLSNDLIMYRNTIPAGESTEAVLVIEMKKEDVETITSIKMTIKSGDGRAETTLL